MQNPATSHWYPIASCSDLPFRHTYHGQLFGREFAVWRADDGHVNVWENRCLHRGVRLSIGINDGKELKCQYHGWRYANRTAGCTYIPAHPADAPARTICNRTYKSYERYGLVWSGEKADGEFPVIEALEKSSPFVLRSIPVNAPPELVTERLCDYDFSTNRSTDSLSNSTTTSVNYSENLLVHLRAEGCSDTSDLVFFIQPIDAHRSVIRGVLTRKPDTCDEISVLKFHNNLLTRLRADIEAQAAEMPQPDPIHVDIRPLTNEQSTLPDSSTLGRRVELRVQVTRKWQTAEGIAAFELSPLSGVLPTFHPGAHIDVHMPNGLIRQYSLTNGPGESQHYVIAVKLEADSSGGSVCMHNQVRENDVLAISVPRNNFPLRRDAVRTDFIAGGIGITPLLSMALALQNSNLDFKLHYFVQSENHLAFSNVLDQLNKKVVTYLSLTPEQTTTNLHQILQTPHRTRQLYVCGPSPMLEATRTIATNLGWPDDSIHCEYFKNSNEIDDTSTFEVALARSAQTLTVPAGKTILEVMRDNGIDLPSSCEQGACGTCMATVLEGEPNHQDVYLSQSEKQRNNKIMTCVSRAKSNRLVLDL